MPKTKYETKNAIIYFRVTETIRESATSQAIQEGISLSEWMRKLMIGELRKRNAIRPFFRLPDVEEDQ